MRMFHIYHHGRHLDTIYAYNKDGALAHFIDDNPMYRFQNIDAVEVYVP